MYLIDGNNLAKQGTLDLSDTKKHQLLIELSLFACSHNTKITVVFDGIPSNQFPEGITFEGIKIYYARAKSTADKRINELTKQCRNNAYIVVTDDRELQKSVRAQNTQIMNTTEFRSKLDTVIIKQQQEAKESKPIMNNTEIKEWIRYFGIESDNEIKHIEKINKKNHKQKSKSYKKVK